MGPDKIRVLLFVLIDPPPPSLFNGLFDQMPVVALPHEAGNCVSGVVFDFFESDAMSLAVLFNVLKVFLQFEIEAVPILLNR